MHPLFNPNIQTEAAAVVTDELLFDSIARGLENQGYVVLPAALPEPVCASLLDYLAVLEQDEFHAASVGRGENRVRNQFVRRDKICWIEELHNASTPWINWATQLRLYLNRRLFLGLFSFESHFSFYSAGDFYRRHVDAFKGDSNRVLSLVTYLNRGWEPDQGGELVLYAGTGEKQLVKIVPSFGTLVLFLSEEYPHEVLPTVRNRYAVSGWFRSNNSINGKIDPPR